MTSFPPSSPQPSDAPYGQSGSPDPAPGTDLASDLGAGLKFAGRAMLRNPVAYLVPGLIYAVLILIAVFAGIAAPIGLIGARADELASSDAAMVGLILLSIGLSFVAVLLALLIAGPWQSGVARAGEVILDGGRPSIGQALIGPGRVVATAMLVLVIINIGSLLLYIPGLIASVLLFYAIPAAARGASPAEAMRTSARVAMDHLGTTIVAWLAVMVASSVVMFTVVGIVIVVPFMVLLQLGMYERLNGRALPEPARS